MDENIMNELWEYAERENKRIYKWLNKDNLSNIIVDGNVFWFELTSSLSIMPNWVYKWLKKWCNKKGLTYVFDLPTKF